MKIKSLTKSTDESGFKGTSCLWKFSILLIIIGITLYIVGFSTNEWVKLEFEEEKIIETKNGTEVQLVLYRQHFGLWRDCVVVDYKGKEIDQKCDDMGNKGDWRPAAKVLCSIGLGLQLIGLIAAVIGGGKNYQRFMGIGGTTIILGAVIAAVGCAVFAGKAKDDFNSYDPGYSVFLALIGCMIIIIGGGGQLFSIKSEYSTIA